MKMKARFTAGLAGAALLTGASLIGTAGAAQAGTSELSVTVCSDGNYTSYVKFVGSGFNTDQTHVAAGSCFTDSASISGPIDMYLFGIYNVSHKGFEVAEFGGVRGTVGVDSTGITTDPSFAVSASGPGLTVLGT